ncbi:MAG: hypothetical protein M1823_000842 [Watsoniomyces obsoletus]|nr:MAG: hypothetical protein M1823_000842 [Watsoniomyces obsoletus]
MATNNSNLYGIPRPKKSAKEISSSTSLAFTSQLSSLLSKDDDKSRTTTSGRPRPSHSKSDIFTAHNKNTKKRAAKDLEDDGFSTPQTRTSSAAAVDPSILHRSKRKMEEKARLYAAMKRGDYVPPENKRGANNLEENALVDFDRKWAENEERGKGNELDTSSDDDDDDHEEDNNDNNELIEYTDEFGRQRQGTRAEVAREERRKRILAADEPDRFTARPAEPSNLIYGDTVQVSAFNPDEPIVAKMEEIVAKRDRSMTPPEETHYDANTEIRSKGVGFFAFSKGKEEREKEMNELVKERLETERNRKEMIMSKEKRKLEVEGRRKKIREMRGEKQADRFLESLVGEMEKNDDDDDGDGKE